MIQAVENYLAKRFVRLHGEGEPHQAQVYRCTECKALIDWKKIKAGTVCCSGRISPTNPKWYEKIRLLAFS